MTRIALIAIAVLGFVGVIVWGGDAALGKIDRMVATAVASARGERDAHWSAQIALANAEAQARIARAIREAMVLQDAARDQIAEVDRRAAQLEKENAALPDTGACSLGRDRVRLLNQR